MAPRRPLRFLLLLLACNAGLARDGRACAVSTTVEVENQGVSPVRSLFVSQPNIGSNQLREGELAPGGTTRVVLPSCLGIYGISAVFADGRVVTYPSLDAHSIRRLSLR